MTHRDRVIIGTIGVVVFVIGLIHPLLRGVLGVSPNFDAFAFSFLAGFVGAFLIMISREIE